MNLSTRLIAGAAAMLAAWPGGAAGMAGDVAAVPASDDATAAAPAVAGRPEAGRSPNRATREHDERLARLKRQYQKQMGKCQRGNRYACDDARVTYAEIQDLAAARPAGN